MATGSRTTPVLPVTDDSSPHCVERWDGGRDIPVDAHQMRPEPGGDRWSLPVAARHRTPLGQGLSAIAGDQRDGQVVHPHGTRAGIADVAGQRRLPLPFRESVAGMRNRYPPALPRRTGIADRRATRERQSIGKGRSQRWNFPAMRPAPSGPVTSSFPHPAAPRFDRSRAAWGRTGGST